MAKRKLSVEEAQDLVQGRVAPVKVRPSYRTILGCLHCIHNSDLENYILEAKRLGYKERVDYSASERNGVILGNKIKDLRDNLICIISGSRPNTTVSFGKVGKIDA